MTSPAPADGIVIALASNHAAVTVPASVTIAAGQVAATFTVATQNVTQETPALITATMSGSTRSVPVTVIPSLQIAEMRLSHEAVVGGTSAFGTVSGRSKAASRSSSRRATATSRLRRLR